ncbi:MAG: hypothetical protein GF387_01065 [Candidatus Portnoybacteria bacterium]|nr:hypothetical protein [Candidatus Portnoybacteria bacterium]
MELDKKQFKFIKPLAWKEVFNIWKNNEANEEHWKEYCKEKGFDSWFEWRKKYIEPIKKQSKDWKLFKILNPLESVPQFRGGPYNGWTKNFYKNQEMPRLKNIKENPAIKQYLDNFPSKTTIITWNTEDGIIIIEGMHKCAAITKAAKEGINIKTDLYMAISDSLIKDIPSFVKK